VHLEAAGGDTTRVRITAPGDMNADALEQLAEHLRHFLELKGEAPMPLVGTMVSPGAPNAGMNDVAGRDTFPPGARRGS
jgi:hypothetical protein